MMMGVHCFQRSLCVASSPLVPVKLPSRMETHLWYILPDEVKSATLLNQYMELLTPPEKENILRIHSDPLRKNSLLSRALVRTTIARYQINHHVDPKSLRFRKSSYGKPEVDWGVNGGSCLPALQFNISHSSSLIACGVTMESPVGIDVEEKQRKMKNGVLNLAQRFFSPHELEILSSISDTEIQHQEFIKLWTLKEAYVKALGRGFSAAPFKTFTIHFKDGTTHLSNHRDSKDFEILVESVKEPDDLTGNWKFALMELAGLHYVAICMENGGGKGSSPMKVWVRKTIPLIGDEFVSGTDDVVRIGGLFDVMNFANAYCIG